MWLKAQAPNYTGLLVEHQFPLNFLSVKNELPHHMGPPTKTSLTQWINLQGS